MLRFSPDERLTVKQCLRHPIFNSLRVEDLEQDSGFKISIPVDKKGAFDYKGLSDHEVDATQCL